MFSTTLWKLYINRYFGQKLVFIISTFKQYSRLTRYHQNISNAFTILLLSLCVSVATAKVITGVFNSFDSLTWTRAGNYVIRAQIDQLGMLFWAGL